MIITALATVPMKSNMPAKILKVIFRLRASRRVYSLAIALTSFPAYYSIASAPGQGRQFDNACQFSSVAYREDTQASPPR